MRKTLGYSLLELLLAMSILSLVSWAIISIWINGQKTYDTATALADAQAEARRAMVMLEQEMRAASRSNISIASNELILQTILADQTSLTSVRYYVAAETIDDSSVQVLYREVPAGSGNKRMLARYISAFSSIYDPINENLRSQLGITVKDRSANLSTTVRPRNP